MTLLLLSVTSLKVFHQSQVCSTALSLSSYLLRSAEQTGTWTHTWKEAPFTR